MKNLISVLLLFCLVTFSYSQVSDQFSDGDFTSNPSWTGDENVFKINTAFQLQLNNDGFADTSTLQTINHLIDSTSWEFYIKLSFSPSSNNLARVYLASDQENLQGALNGYFLQFGEAGSSDAIELFRQDGEVVTSICRGVEASIASSFTTKIKVIHQNNGLWSVYSDFNLTGSYLLECQGNDQTYSNTNYFGFFCKYTSSNATKFYFDDVEIQYFQVDNQAPKVNSVLVEGPKNLTVLFTEAISSETGENTNNYIINQSVGNPVNAVLNAVKNEVSLEFANDFNTDENYEISISNLEDLSGNIMNDTIIHFSLNILEPYDVVINEIMADPSPVVQLPEVEFLEIYNRTNASIDLNNWTLEIGTSIKTFPSKIIPPEGYLILCHQNNIALMSDYGDCIGFSSFSLTNSAQTINLFESSGMLMHSVSYTDKWYQDPNKDEGGWTLEQINPSDFCSEQENWRASEDVRGGSPGSENSVYNSTLISPEVRKLEIADNPLLLLTFNQQMQLEDILNKNAYSVSPGIGQPNQVIVYDTSRSVYLSFSDPFEIGIEYKLLINQPMRNCAGQELSIPVEIPFMLNKFAEAGDVVINEIMADPEPAVSLPPFEYLELLNTSNAPISLSNWTLNFGSTSKMLEDLVIQPQGFVLLCSEEASTYLSEFGQTYAVPSFSLTNAGNQLVLRNMIGSIIHQVEYSDSWYGDADKADGGWSLEAIDPLDYCMEQGNWSASISAMGGTPGAVNSINGTATQTEDLNIHRIEILNENNIRVTFTHKMDSSTLGNPANYLISEDFGNPLQCIIEGPKYNSVQLVLSQSLIKGIVYILYTQPGLLECNGGSADLLASRFAIPDQVDMGDIVFNEILFDAAIDNGEFIELVNVSDKILETSVLSISRIKINQYDTTWYTGELGGHLLFPDDYVAFAKSPSQVLKVYFSESPEKIIMNTDLPDLPGTEGIVLLHLSSSKDSIIDKMEYSEAMHYSLLNTTKGVSLEKINLEGGNQASNWHSAASSVNYGTPSYQNSQFQEAGQASSNFELSPEVFSPDNDGFDDLLQINYKMEDAGYSLNLIVYDSRGRKVKQLTHNELLGSSGSFYWNGETEDFQKASVGIYILLFEYFDLQGNVKTEKLTTVLGGRL